MNKFKKQERKENENIMRNKDEKKLIVVNLIRKFLQP